MTSLPDYSRITKLKKNLSAFLIFGCLMLAMVYPGFTQQWNLQNPLPTNADLLDIFLLNHDTGYVCGAYQTILKTTDGGATWQRKGVPGDNHLNSIAFNSHDTGFAVGGRGIMRTLDGGETWELLPHPFPETPTALNDIFFLDQQHGWISGDYYTMLRTVDGGMTWELLSHNVGLNQSFNIIKFLSPDTGFVAGTIGGQFRLLKKTVDGGVSWTNITIPMEITGVSGLEVLSANEIWIGAVNQINTVNGPATRIYHTIDGGITWTSTDLVYWSPTTQSIKFFDPLHGHVLTNYLMFNTSDGGITWQQQILSYDAPVQDAMAWADTSKCITAGYYGYLFNSEDGGQTWGEVSHGTKANFTNIFFTNTMTGYAVGWKFLEPVIYKTINAGDTWTKIPIDTTNVGRLSAVCFSDESNGWTAGYWGQMLHTSDAGQTWNAAGPVSGITYYALDLYTKKYIWAGGFQGKMVRSTDYGNTWQDISLPWPDYDLLEISFADSLNGYVRLGNGSDGMMFRTSDGGMTWNPIDFINEQTKKVRSMSFTDAETGFVCISGEGLAKTSDGGATWQSLGKIGNIVPTYIKFFSPQNGVAAADGYFLAVTYDGGETWDTLIHAFSEAGLIRGYFFTDQDHGWLAGWHGLIEAYTSVGVGVPGPGSSHEQDPVVFPNPADKSITIASNCRLPVETIISVFNMKGEQVIQGKFHNQNPVEMDVSMLAKGIYLVNIQTRDGIESKKLVIH